jgi:hypothetical protein
MSCPRGDWMSWPRGAWMSCARGAWTSCDLAPASEREPLLSEVLALLSAAFAWVSSGHWSAAPATPYGLAELAEGRGPGGYPSLIGSA